jgi:hypothetical protein
MASTAYSIIPTNPSHFHSRLYLQHDACIYNMTHSKGINLGYRHTKQIEPAKPEPSAVHRIPAYFCHTAGVEYSRVGSRPDSVRCYKVEFSRVESRPNCVRYYKRRPIFWTEFLYTSAPVHKPCRVKNSWGSALFHPNEWGSNWSVCQQP